MNSFSDSINILMSWIKKDVYFWKLLNAMRELSGTVVSVKSWQIVSKLWQLQWWVIFISSGSSLQGMVWGSLPNYIFFSRTKSGWQLENFVRVMLLLVFFLIFRLPRGLEIPSWSFLNSSSHVKFKKQAGTEMCQAQGWAKLTATC